MATPLIYNLSLWTGDTAPPVIWRFNIDLTGSVMQLKVRFGDRVRHFRSDTGGLVIDLADDSVRWNYTPQMLQYRNRDDGRYELSRILAGGEIRTYVAGLIEVKGVLHG